VNGIQKIMHTQRDDADHLGAAKCDDHKLVISREHRGPEAQAQLQPESAEASTAATATTPDSTSCRLGAFDFSQGGLEKTYRWIYDDMQK